MTDMINQKDPRRLIFLLQHNFILLQYKADIIPLIQVLANGRTGVRILAALVFKGNLPHHAFGNLLQHNVDLFMSSDIHFVSNRQLTIQKSFKKTVPCAFTKSTRSSSVAKVTRLTTS